jgi:hypothetical protein
MTPTGMHTAAQHADEVPAPVRMVEKVFPAIPAQLREVRHFLAGLLGSCPVADDAVTCLSELAANACLHSASARPDGTFTLRVRIRNGGRVRIEVADEGGPWVQRVHDDDWPHGLAIVASLAAGSGVYGDAAVGRTSWAEFIFPGHDKTPE